MRGSHIIALAGHEDLAVEGDGVKRRPSGDDRRPVGPLVGLLGRALGLGRRVGHRHHHRRRGVLGHGPYDVLCEQPARLRGQPEEARRLELVDDLEHRGAVGDGLVDPRRALVAQAARGVRVAVRAVRLPKRPHRGAHDEARHRLLVAEPSLDHPVHNLCADAEPGRAGARAQERPADRGMGMGMCMCMCMCRNDLPTEGPA